MTLLEEVKEVLRSKGMSFTELAALMEVPRPSLYKSIQTESIRYSTLCKLGVVLQIDIAKLVNNVDAGEIVYLNGVIGSFIHVMNDLGFQLVSLKNGRTTIAAVQENFDQFAEMLQTDFPDRIRTMKQIEETYRFSKRPDGSGRPNPGENKEKK